MNCTTQVTCSRQLLPTTRTVRIFASFYLLTVIKCITSQLALCDFSSPSSAIT